MKKDRVKVGLLDVLKAFWKGVRPQKIAMSYTLFAFSTSSVLYVLIPLVYKRFFDTLTSGGDIEILSKTLIGLIALVFGINFVTMVLNRTAFFVLNDFESKTMARLKQISFDYLMNHSYSFFSNSFAGSLVQRVGRFSRSFERLYDTLVFNIIPLSINITGALIVIWLHKPLIALLVLIWVTIIMFCQLLFSKWKVKYDLEASKADSTTTAVLADNISNQNTVVLFNNFRKESDFFKGTTNNQASAQKYTWNLGAIMDAIQVFTVIVIEFLIFYFAVKYWKLGTITIGTFVLLQAYILGLSQRLWDFGKIIRNLYEAFADSKEMVEILSLSHEIKNLPGALDLKVANGNIKFENTTFGFNGGRLVLDNFNLEVTGGEKVALIGPSGAGKSTIVKTLLRMYDLSSGSIFIDGQDIKQVTQESLRQNISLVPQEPALFHRSLLENIHYGRPSATDEEVFEAARLAHCDEFISTLPLKYETLVGERGIKLSGGERQRVAIARAILKNAPILILDEATSSLDSHSESLIQDALDKLMKGKTSIVIAHRLSTIRKMDRIVVIKNGQILEDGDHESLLSKDEGLYKKLWTLQAGGFLTV
jgi:ATP-binding cassette subfamily B protein